MLLEIKRNLKVGWKLRSCEIIHVSFFSLFCSSCFLSWFCIDAISIFMFFLLPPPFFFAISFFCLLLFSPFFGICNDFAFLCFHFHLFLFPRLFLISMPTPLLFSVIFYSSFFSLRSQWMWLRGECRAPLLRHVIKAMPTPRLHMSSHQSKRGGVLLIRSVSCNANTQACKACADVWPKHLRMLWLNVCCFVRLLLCHWKKCPWKQVCGKVLETHLETYFCACWLFQNNVIGRSFAIWCESSASPYSYLGSVTKMLWK